MVKGLVWDIETSPMIVYKWAVWDDGIIEMIEDKQVLSVAWQWVGEKKVHVKGQDDFKGYKPGVIDDKAIVTFIRDLLDQCDYEVAHNGDQFDVKVVNARMLVHGLTPPSPYKQIDTKKIAKRIGGFTSNRLKDLAQSLSVAQKGDSGGFSTWKGCLAGDKKAWKQLKKYNKQDIPPLMDLYMKFRPWDNSGVPLNVLNNRPDSCPKCGGTRINAGMKYRATSAQLYQYFRCMNCGGNIKRRLPEPREPDERMQYV